MYIVLTIVRQISFIAEAKRGCLLSFYVKLFSFFCCFRGHTLIGFLFSMILLAFFIYSKLLTFVV